jgi:zinc transport system substrate-binding protein
LLQAVCFPLVWIDVRMTALLRLAMAIAWACLAFSHSASATSPRVVVSIKPIHSLAAALLDGIAEPELLVDGPQSPHSFAMRPSQSRALRQADLVVWVGPELEGFLVKTVSVLPESARVVSLLSETPGLERLHWNEADDDHNHNHSVHSGEETFDPHIWLSPKNARAIAAYLADEFRSYTDSPKLDANAKALDHRLAELDRALVRQLAPVKSLPFVVLHPAYNYLVHAYGLTQAGVVALNPEHGASAGHLAELRTTIAKSKAVCIFSEPQFGAKSVQALASSAGLRVGILDPLGAEIAPGPEAYAAILQSIADALAGCLGP